MTNKATPDLVLVNPANQKKIYQSLSSSLTAIENPVWAGLMAAFVEKKGFSVEIIDATALNLGPEEVADQIADLNPVLTAVVVYGHQPSASTQVMPGASAVCSAIKRHTPEARVILVGGHVAALPERTLREEDADFVASGEGLYTLVELLQALKAKAADLSKVHDLWYREDGHIRVTAPAPLLQNLDEEMPGIPWHKLPMEIYRAHNWHCFDGLQRQPYASIYTTLGCPYHCNFCCIQAPFKSGEKVIGIQESVNSYRLWNPRTIIEQIDLLVTEYGVRNIKFADEMFVLNKRHVNTLCDLIIERGYDLNIWAYTRVDTIKDGMLEKMKRAGINWLAFGFEAGNDRVRSDAQKGVDQDDIYKIVEKVRETDTYIIGNYIFGLPEDDKQTMQETLNMAVELNCEFANFYSAMAYPGSELYRIAQAEGWQLPETWSAYSQHSFDTMPLPTKYLSTAEVLRFRDQAFQTYFTNDRYLDMVTDKFGPETTNHIKEMTSVRLERWTDSP